MIIYNIGIYIFAFIVKLASFRLLKAKQMTDGRKDIFKRLKEQLDSNSEIVWFHSSSLGEFEQGRPVIEEYKRCYPHKKLLLTFFSPSGYEVRKNYDGVDYIFYLPYDTKSDVKRFLDIVKPTEVYFIKYEFWINYMSEIKRRGIKFYIFSSIFNPKQLFFKWYGGFYRKTLLAFTHIFVQDENSKTLLNGIGLDNVTVAGDTRFDRVYEITKESKELPIIASFKGDSSCFICGSSWEADDEIVCNLIRLKRDKIKFIIAPHELGKQKILSLQSTLNSEGFKTALYTESNEESVVDVEVLIINCIGILSSIYKYGDASMIGGGFGVGIHNTLEAATFGLPLIFGENYQKFKEAIDLVSIGVATPIKGSEDAEKWFDEFFQNSQLREELSKKASDYVSSKIGATKIILEQVLNN